MTTDTQIIEVQHTDHALLVGLGMFGRQIGLFEVLDEVRFPGRVYKRSPQRKLRELMAALAAGYRDLQATHSCQPLPHMYSPTVSEYYGLI